MIDRVDVYSPDPEPLPISKAAAKSGVNVEVVRLIAGARNEIVGVAGGELLVHPRIVARLREYVRRGTIAAVVEQNRNRSNSSLS